MASLSIYIIKSLIYKFTFSISRNENDVDIMDVQQQQLVLDVLPNSDRVILNRKEIGARSQFWRMTSSGQLQHEGSSPPVDPRAKRMPKDDNVLVRSEILADIINSHFRTVYQIYTVLGVRYRWSSFTAKGMREFGVKATQPTSLINANVAFHRRRTVMLRS